MNKSRISFNGFLLCLIILSCHQIVAVVCEAEQQNEGDGRPLPFIQAALTTISLMKKSHQSYWEKVKTIVHGFQLQFSPPNLDFRSRGASIESDSESVGETMKDAIKKSMEVSKSMVEETAKCAAEIAGEAVHKGTEKVKVNEHLSHKDDTEL